MEIKKVTPSERQLILYAIGLLMTDAYFERYFDILHELGSNRISVKLAFHHLEDELQALTGENRYTDYNSFREMRRRYAVRVSKDRKRTKTG